MIEYKLISPKTKEFVSIEIIEEYTPLISIPAYAKLYNRVIEKGMKPPFVLEIIKDGVLTSEYFNSNIHEESETKEGIYEL